MKMRPSPRCSKMTGAAMLLPAGGMESRDAWRSRGVEAGGTPAIRQAGRPRYQRRGRRRTVARASGLPYRGRPACLRSTPLHGVPTFKSDPSLRFRQPFSPIQ